jgi:hypothetical protein
MLIALRMGFGVTNIDRWHHDHVKRSINPDDDNELVGGHGDNNGSDGAVMLTCTPLCCLAFWRCGQCRCSKSWLCNDEFAGAGYGEMMIMTMMRCGDYTMRSCWDSSDVMQPGIFKYTLDYFATCMSLPPPPSFAINIGTVNNKGIFQNLVS